MTPRSPSTSLAPTAAHRRARALGLALALVVATAVALATTAATAGAQTTTLPVPPTTLPAENPGSTAAGVVFFGVVAVIIVGALVLYLRNRRPAGSTPTP